MIAKLIETPKGHKLHKIEWLTPTKFVIYFNRKPKKKIKSPTIRV